MSAVFRDCIGREIKVGDVLANGARDGNHGSISLGIVRGFTETPLRESIVVTQLQRGHLYEYKSGKGTWWMSSDTGDTWRFVEKRHYTIGERCFITGLTEDELRALIAKATEEAKKQ